MSLSDQFDQNLNQKTDTELVNLVLVDPENFGLIIDRYTEPLSRYIGRLTRVDEDEIKDILQEVFIKAYRNLNDFDNSLKFSSWIYRIAHNQAIDFWRRSQSRPSITIDPDDLFWTTIADEIDLEDQARKNELKYKVKDLVDQLEGDYRSAIILRFLEEKDYQEISDIMKKPIGTVATLINRAKKKLKKIAEEQNQL